MRPVQGEFIFGYFWLFFVIFCYFLLFFVIFGNLRMGNSTDVVFCLQAYMNPFARWLDHGRFQCNFCGATSECPREYMCNLGADGRRMDWAQRPELCRGSVEYAAPG